MNESDVDTVNHGPKASQVGSAGNFICYRSFAFKYEGESVWPSFRLQI